MLTCKSFDNRELFVSRLQSNGQHLMVYVIKDDQNAMLSCKSWFVLSVTNAMNLISIEMNAY